MTLSNRSKRPDPALGPQPVPQPRIWVEGQQRPRFDMRAYLATSLGMARRDLDPEIVEAVQRLQGFGQRVQRGEIRVAVAWAGPVARIVPSHGRAGGWMLALAQLLSDSRRLILPDEEPDAPIAYPNLAFSNPAPAVPPQPCGPTPARSAVEPTLHAIRAAIGQDAPPEISALRPPIALALGPHMPGPLGRVLWALACRVTLGILLAFALPGGAVKALLFHLDGGDLADWS